MIPKDELIKMARTRCVHHHTLLEHPQCYEKAPEHLGFLDIESSNLNADFGIMLSYAIKELDGKTFGRVITKEELASRTNDKKLVNECIKDMKKFDRLVTYYGTGFDLPFIRTRSLLWKLPFPIHREIKHTDVFYWAKSKLCLHRKRLQVVCDFLGIPSKMHPMEPNQWTAALTGSKWALNYIWIHNKEDVVALEAAYKRLLEHTANRSNSV
jgi:uncharacterized protein YprB with RNaseH-like and TPR domain